ncbi:MAG: hypothetical protein WCW40_11685 [Bacteroidota bacterium]
MKQLPIALFGMFIILFGVGVGCNSDDPVASGSSSTPVNLSVGFSKIGSNNSLSKYAVVDSLRIDSVIVVLQKIKFESHIESATIDTSGKDTTETEFESNYMFRGPFVVHVRDSSTVSFANQTLPAGIYTGIKFKIHAFRKGEKCEDSDEHNHRVGTANNDSMTGYSIAVWGGVKQNGVWVPFAYKTNIEVEFKLRGNFTIASSTSAVKIALRFNTGDWFQDVQTGALLDPTDSSSRNRELIKEAIKKSFEKGRGGRDSNNDGHPDD